MVTSVLSAVRADLARFAEVVRGAPVDEGPPVGLSTYRFDNGVGETRLSLRIHGDGSGALFRDVTDVIHLSPSAAEMAYLALEKTEPVAAVRVLRRRYRESKERLRRDYAQVRRIVETLEDARVPCHTCALDLPKVPLFSTRGKAPHKVDLALTYACNNRCPHCYNDPSRFDMRALPPSDWKRILDQLGEVGVPQVIFTGGEATVYKHLPELISHADGLGMVVGLNSNGRRLGDASYVAELAAAGLDHVQITLESHEAAIHDAMVGAKAFEECVRGVRTCVAQEGLHTITNSTITRLNAGSIGETVEFLAELGLTTFAMNGMIYSGGGDANPDAIPQDQLPAILVEVKETADERGLRFLWYTVTEYCEMSPVELEIGAKRCNAGEYSMCIEPNGDVLPCQSYYVAAGNMLEDPWESIWKGELFRSFREREADPAWAGLPDKCHDCMDLPLCGGGCRIERESREGKAPGGCQSCASGGLAPGKGIRSTGISAASTCTCDETGDASSCGSDVHRGLVQLRRPDRSEAAR